MNRLPPRVRYALFAGLSLIMVTIVAVLNWPAAKPTDGPDGTKRPTRPGQASAHEPEEPPPERLSILVVGTDSRPDDPGRTDTIMVATIDTGTGEVHLLSIPRDTWVFIPNHGWDKINHAYAVAPDDARPETVKAVVSDLLGVKIDHHVVVHMGGFQDVVDRLGGVNIHVEKDMYYYDPKDTPPLIIDLKEGQQRLSGEDALKYVRFRSDDQGDWGRMARQQKFLKALAKEALQVRNITKVGSLVKAIKAAIEMDLGESDLLRLSLSARKLNLEQMNTQIIGGYDRLIGGIYFMEPAIADARTLAYRQVYGKEPPQHVLDDAAADFAEARYVIENEIARFEELARQEAEAAAEEEDPDAEPGDGEDDDNKPPTDDEDNDTDLDDDAEDPANGDTGAVDDGDEDEGNGEEDGGNERRRGGGGWRGRSGRNDDGGDRAGDTLGGTG